MSLKSFSKKALAGVASAAALIGLAAAPALAASEFGNNLWKFVGDGNTNTIDFNRGGSKIFDNAQLNISTDSELFLNAPQATVVSSNLDVRGTSVKFASGTTFTNLPVAAGAVALSPATAQTILPTANVVPLTLQESAGGNANLLNLLSASAVNVFSVGATGDTAVGGTLAVTGNVTLNGNVTLGDAAGDTITFTGTPNFGTITATTFVGNTLNGSAVTSTGALYNNITTGAVGLATGLTTGNLTLGGAQTTGTITVGVATQTGNVAIHGGVTGGANTLFNGVTTSTIAIGGALTTGTLTLGNTTATGNTTYRGTQTTGVNSLFNNTTTANTTVLSGQTAGTIAIGGTAGTGALSIGESTGAQALNFGTGNAVKTIVVGNATAGGASVTTIHAGTGGLNLATTNDARTIAIGTGTGAQTWNVGTGAAVQTVNMFTGNVANVLIIGNATAGTAAATTIHAGTGGLNLGTTADARTIAIGTGAAIQTVNMFTGAAVHVIRVGNAADPPTGTIRLSGSNTVVNGGFNYGIDAQANDTYVVTLAPALTDTGYTAGQVVYFLANTANTDGATLNVNGLGAVAVVKRAATVLANGDIEALMIAHVVFDGTSWQLMNPVVE